MGSCCGGTRGGGVVGVGGGGRDACPIQTPGGPACCCRAVSEAGMGPPGIGGCSVGYASPLTVGRREAGIGPPGISKGLGFGFLALGGAMPGAFAEAAGCFGRRSGVSMRLLALPCRPLAARASNSAWVLAAAALAVAE